MSYETLLVDTQDGVCTITLNRPKNLNALSVKLLTELSQALDAAAVDNDCRAVLLTGAGRAFSSGADLMDPDAKMTPPNIDLKKALDERYHPVVHAVRNMPKPVIAAMNGIAAGAGCNIGLNADIVLAGKSTKFIQVFVRIGLLPDASGTWIIPRKIGRERTMRWMMTGDDLDAETAERWGLISEVCEDDELLSRAQALATRMAVAPTQSLARIKKLVDASFENDLPEQLEMEGDLQNELARTGDFMEGVMAFVQKREANFKGK